jgi:predicted dehydrogenase
MTTDRRQFLMAGAAGLSARFAFATPAERKVRLGVVGGSFGASFFFHEHPNCIVEAVSDLRPERREHLMKVYGCKNSYESLEKMLFDKNVDAVFCATPAPDHLRHVALTLEAGKHVMSAVPAVLGSLEDCHKLIEAVKKSGLKYMMAETSYYHQTVISARRYYKEGRFGRILSAEAEYHHPGVEELYFENGKRTWRHGLAPMHYPTHCTSMLTSVTGERLTQVSCIGWGDESPVLNDNAYRNPFWNETALFQTDRGTAFRVHVYWRGALRGTERGQWIGTKMSLFCPDPNGLETVMIQAEATQEKDAGGFVRYRNERAPYQQPVWWKTDMLPAAMRHESWHDGSHTFLTHEFIQSIVENRKPAIDVYEAVAYTAPGIVAHESALHGGERLKIPRFDPA